MLRRGPLTRLVVPLDLKYSSLKTSYFYLSFSPKNSSCIPQACLHTNFSTDNQLKRKSNSS